jgi:5-methylcytosine-specific restriction endonuclease McrA
MSQGRRTLPLPDDWPHLRQQILKRDGHTCQIRFPDICTTTASEVDHIIPSSKGGGHEPANLQATCPPCHARKTGREAQAARQVRYDRRRKPEPHPGHIN